MKLNNSMKSTMGEDCFYLGSDLRMQIKVQNIYLKEITTTRNQAPWQLFICESMTAFEMNP